VAYGASGNLTAKSLYCCYDPYHGEWLDGDIEAIKRTIASHRPEGGRETAG
jgi:hypothetical protein